MVKQILNYEKDSVVEQIMNGERFSSNAKQTVKGSVVKQIFNYVRGSVVEQILICERFKSRANMNVKGSVVEQNKLWKVKWSSKY